MFDQKIKTIKNIFGLSVFFYFFLLHVGVNAVVPGFIKSIKILHVNSVKQQVVDKNIFIFEGEVEIIVDQKLHLWADRVEFNKNDETLLAVRVNQGPVLLENNDITLLADRLFLDFGKKTGFADNMSIHVDEGYLSASRAEKINDSDWQMHDMVYTPCDDEQPHWHFKARKAKVHGSYFIRATNLVFKVNNLPLFLLPKMILPIQGRSKSGFLIPKFSYDYDFGFGVKQEYYWHIHRHCDTTFSFDWRMRRGFAFSNEFRLARAPEEFTIFNGCYAVVRDTFIQKEGEIVNATDHRYRLTGKDFRALGYDILGADVYSLVRLDYGTDKQTGYTFFNNLEEVDDTFNNSWIIRSFWPKNVFEVKLEDAKTNRKRFSDLSKQELQWINPLVEKLQQTSQKYNEKINGPNVKKKSVEDDVEVAYLPHFEWNTAFKNLGKFFSYRHDFFVDQVFYRQWQNEAFYVNSMLIDQDRLIPFSKTDVLRICYSANLHKSFFAHGNMVKAFIQPHVQMRSHILQDKHMNQNVIEEGIFGKGAVRFFCDYGLEWALPEVVASDEHECFMHYMQPVITWNYVPKFYQDHWFYIDRRDKTYPKNQIGFGLRNNVILGQTNFDVNVFQGFDFYKQDDIFYLRRGLSDEHFLPLRYDLGWAKDWFNINFSQEFDWQKSQLLQSEIHAGLSFKKFSFDVSYLFQNELMQKRRGLLSNIPHFLVTSVAIPLGDHATLGYTAQLYSEKNKHFASLFDVRPLLHQIRFDYDGHCWGFYVGFESKQYREHGVDRSEKAFVFSFRLDSLGSFAKKIRGPQAIKHAPV